MKKKVAVTGGSGFVGNWVRMELAKNGMKPITLDMRPPNVGEYRRCNVMSVAELKFALSGCDSVIHLAAISNTQEALKNPSRCFGINVLGTAHVLQAALETGVQHVVVASSSLVSGQQMPYAMNWTPDNFVSWKAEDGSQGGKMLRPELEHLVVDELAPFQIERTVHPYVASKVAAEGVALSMHAQSDVDVSVARLGIMYGEYMTPGVLFDHFLRAASNGQPLTIDGEGQQWRQYLHVQDTAVGLVEMLKQPDQSAGEIFNLTPMQKTTVADVAEAFCKAYPGTKVQYGPERKGDIEVRFCMSSKAKQKLGWEPTIGLDAGVARLVKWWGEVG